MFPRRKYKNKRTTHAGRSFASQLEAAVYDLLMLREAAGDIYDIQCQDHVYLSLARICYTPDFKFFDVVSGSCVWAEAKGFPTPEWKIKKRLWEYYGPGKLEIYTGSAKRIIGPEILTPEG